MSPTLAELAATNAYLPPAATPMQIGAVRLNVRDLDGVARYYETLLGLAVLGREGNVVRLGAGGNVLLELNGDAGRKQRDPRGAGLFHTAFLMPTREDLAQWLRYVASNRMPIVGASDHLVSEAIYLSDPEGNGIEVYSDRPVSAWPIVGTQVEMPSNQFDVDALFSVGTNGEWHGAPDGLTVGHMHLQVGRISTAEEFYRGVLGMNVTCRYPGGVFYGAGGYHHQLATNMWNSRGAGAIETETAGLAGFDILVDADQLPGIGERAGAAGLTLVDVAGGLQIADGSGLPIVLKAK